MHARVHGHVHVRACSSTLVICPSPSMSIWSKSSSACHMHYIHIYTYIWDQICRHGLDIYTCLGCRGTRMVRHRTPEAGTRTAYLQQGLTRAKLPCASGTYSTARRRLVRVPRTYSAWGPGASSPAPPVRTAQHVGGWCAPRSPCVQYGGPGDIRVSTGRRQQSVAPTPAQVKARAHELSSSSTRPA